MQGTAIVRHVVTFGRVLREVGIEVGPGRAADAMRGLGAVDLTRQEDVYFTLDRELELLKDAGFTNEVTFRKDSFAVVVGLK